MSSAVSHKIFGREPRTSIAGGWVPSAAWVSTAASVQERLKSNSVGANSAGRRYDMMQQRVLPAAQKESGFRRARGGGIEAVKGLIGWDSKSKCSNWNFRKSHVGKSLPQALGDLALEERYLWESPGYKEPRGL